MATGFGFPRQARLIRQRDFRRVYEAGVRFRAFPLRFRALRCAEGKSRLGLAVSAKVGDSPVRSRWKRAIREAFRLNRHRLRAPYDVVASVDWQASPDDVHRVEAALLKLFEHLNRSEQAEKRP